MSTIKVYVHPSKLENLRIHMPILAKTMTMSQYDVELNLSLSEYHIIEQQNGLLIRKLRWYERLFRFIHRGDV